MTTKTPTRFQTGDRVRCSGQNRPDEIYTLAGYFKYPDGWRAHMANGSVVLLDGPNSHMLELVERAHYAPPGVPMLALTPEIIEEIEDAGLPGCGLDKTRAAIAAAQKVAT